MGRGGLWPATPGPGRRRPGALPRQTPEGSPCHRRVNSLLKVRVGTSRDLEAFLSQVVKATEGVQRTETIIALSSSKETWEPDAGA